MEILEAIEKRRSIRRFQSKEIDIQILSKLVSLAALHTSAANRQPLRFAILTSENRESVHECFQWASSVKNFKISNGQRPRAYILILSEIKSDEFVYFEAGAAATNIMLAALQFNLSSCCLGVANQEQLAQILPTLNRFEIICAIALGYPDQRSVIVPYEGSNRYYQDSKGDMCVPKKDFQDLILA